MVLLQLSVHILSVGFHFLSLFLCICASEVRKKEAMYNYQSVNNLGNLIHILPMNTVR